MRHRHVRASFSGIASAALLALAACAAPPPAARDASAPHEAADLALARIAALKGEWVTADAGAGKAVDVAVSYRVTGGGSAVIETLFPGTPEEMVSVYFVADGDLLLAHYCAVGNQPQLRAIVPTARPIEVLDFDLAGGTGFDPSRDMHMHGMRLQFVSENEIRADWQGWENGKPDPAHVAHLHFVRKPA